MSNTQTITKGAQVENLETGHIKILIILFLRILHQNPNLIGKEVLVSS